MKRSTLALITAVLTLALALPLAAGAGEPAHYSKDSGLTEPVAVHKVNPTYPEAARDAKVQGTVVLDTLIATDGSVRDVKVLQSAGDDLDAAAMDAARQWRFQPARNADGDAVAVYYALTFKFALH